MKRILFYILAITLSISLNADALLKQKGDSGVLPYISLDKLNENLYRMDNKDTILGLGIDVKANKNTNFIIAFEGDIYNENKNKLSIAPAKKIGLYLNGGAITYKFNYKF